MNKGLYRFSDEISATLGNVPNVVEGRLADLIDVLYQGSWCCQIQIHRNKRIVYAKQRA